MQKFVYLYPETSYRRNEDDAQFYAHSCRGKWCGEWENVARMRRFQLVFTSTVHHHLPVAIGSAGLALRNKQNTLVAPFYIMKISKQSAIPSYAAIIGTSLDLITS